MVRGAYYNEHEPFAADWLRGLMRSRLIADGEVDERDIQFVRPEDVRGFTQAHFFAGIGVWSYSLRAAGWADDTPVWTGSCPCQGFSASGQRKGFDDERHLWPTWFRLISESRPEHLFGEQVASKDGLAWFDIVSSDMEGEGYTIGACDTCSAGFGAPHIRQRLYFVAHAEGATLARRAQPGNSDSRNQAQQSGFGAPLGRCRCACGMEHADLSISDRQTSEREQSLCDPRQTNGYWRDAEWIGCGDGKFRPIEPGTFPLADGVASRMDKVRGYGNGLCSEQAIGFIEAYQEHISCVGQVPIPPGLTTGDGL